jgi:quercetin dioxygenase-like cupin family protein
MSTEPQGVIVRPGEGTTIQGPVGGPLEFKVRGEQTGGSMTAFENEVAPGEGPPLHQHANEDETWFVRTGLLRFQIGDQAFEAPAGSYVFGPRGVPHAFQNIGSEPAGVLVSFTPAGMEGFFDEFARLEPGTEIGPQFAIIGGRYGMQVVGPPLAISDPR